MVTIICHQLLVSSNKAKTIPNKIRKVRMPFLQKYRIDVETTLLYCCCKKQINNHNNGGEL